ncbi:unnamed protein product [Rhizophagus irregularis]|nr:unnamed protein product [Rhizophagus irregularis]
MNGFRKIRIDLLDNTGLIRCYTDDWIDQIDQIIWEHLPGTGFRLEDFSFPGSLGYWISASRVLLDIGFRLPGSLEYWVSVFQLPEFFWILDFGFPGSFGYWISVWKRVISASGFFGILDFGFPGSLGYWINFGFPGSFGYWISASWVFLDIGNTILPSLEFSHRDESNEYKFIKIGSLDRLKTGKKKIERIEQIEQISVELSGQSGQTGDTRIERISVDPSGQSGDTTGSI